MRRVRSSRASGGLGFALNRVITDHGAGFGWSDAGLSDAQCMRFCNSSRSFGFESAQNK